MSLFSAADLEFSPEEVSHTVYSMRVKWLFCCVVKIFKFLASAEIHAELLANYMPTADGVFC